MANKPKEIKLIPIRIYAENTLSRDRKTPISVQYVYKQIKAHKKGKKIPFQYIKIGKITWIVKAE